MTIATSLAVWWLLGASVGSFAAVWVAQWPHAPLTRSRSRCDTCRTPLRPIELIPVVSYLLLRGRCRTCQARIPARLWWTEVAFATAFAGIALPLQTLGGAAAVGALTLAAAAVWTLLFIAASVDLDTLMLPDALVLPAAPAALAWLVVSRADAWPVALSAGLFSAAVAVGILMMLNRVGGWLLREGRDTRERLVPISFDSVNIAALAGLWGGLWVGLAAGLLQVLAGTRGARGWRLPEPVWVFLMVLGLIAHAFGVPRLWSLDAEPGVVGALAASGCFAWLGGVYWWWRDARELRTEHTVASSSGGATRSALVDEPVALGFGDVKLAAPLGALLGVAGFLVALMVAVLAGALVGLVVRARGGGNVLPFGPFLVTGGWVAWLWGERLLNAYLRLLGL